MAVPVVEAFTEHSDEGPGSQEVTHDITLPIGTAIGEKLFLAIAIDATQTISSGLSSWTEHIEDSSGSVGGGGGIRFYFYSKTVGASEPNVSFDTAVSIRTVCCLWRVSGVDNDDPVDVSGFDSPDVNVTTSTAPSVTTTVDDCLLFRCFSVGGDRTVTGPGSPVTNNVNTATGNHTGWFGHEDFVTAGATGTRTATWTTGIRTVGATIAVQPAPAAAAGPRGPLGHPLAGPFGGPI